MKNWIGVGLIVLGIVVGLYLGLWVMFIGGIIQVAKGIHPLDTIGIAWGVIRFLLSGVVGWVSAICLIGVGRAMLD